MPRETLPGGLCPFCALFRSLSGGSFEAAADEMLRTLIRIGLAGSSRPMRHAASIAPSLVCLLLAVCLLPEACRRQRPAHMDAAGWKEDLEQLHGELTAKHPMPYRKTAKSSLDGAFDRVIRQLPGLDENHVLVEIQRLVAMLGDGHTSCFPGDQPGFMFRYLPVCLWVFADGIYPLATAQPYGAILGQRLVAIGKRPVDEVFSEVSRLVAADNAKEYDYTVPDLMIRPELLATLGIVDTTAEVPLVFEGADGKRTEVRLPAISSQEYDNKIEWAAARTDLGKVPDVSLRRLFCNGLSRAHLKEAYWYAIAEPEQAVVLEYDKSVYLENAEPVYRMFDQVMAALDAHPDYRLIIDLRNNPGGESRTADRLIDAIAARPSLMQKGKVVELVSRRTFSAAITTAVQLRKRVHAVVIGEHPRGKPNCPSEGRDVVLDNSRLIVSVATKFVERDPDLGDADYLPLDKELDLASADYLRGLDPALEAAFSWER